MIPCKSVTSVQLQPQIGAESGGKLVPFAQSLSLLIFFLVVKLFHPQHTQRCFIIYILEIYPPFSL